MSVPKRLLDILACPKCKEPFKARANAATLNCKHCNSTYDVQNNIPILVTK